MPNWLGGLDPFQHKTPKDLWFLARTELDLHEEGDIELTKVQVRQIKKFLVAVQS